MSAAAPGRLGEPSPLVFHLSAALTAYCQALLAAPRSDSPDFPWAGDLRERAWALGADLDQIEIASEIAGRLRNVLRGIEVWQSHPYRRDLQEPEVIWRSGCSRLLDFGTAPEAKDPQGPPVFIVPSLINRSYILDLARGASFLRWLAARGLRPLLLDWGEPEAAEAGFDLHAYGAQRLLPALRHAQAATGRPVALLGYCMGGTLAAGLAARAPEGVSKLITIGAPWDFVSTQGIAGSFRAMLRSQGTARAERMLDSMGYAFGLAPVSLFQTLFAMVNPIQAAVKFQKLARLDPDSAAARHFVALEDWLADGVPMPVPAAKDLLIGWQIRNDTARGRWSFLGGAVDPKAISMPSLVFWGLSDSIAPAALAAPLARAIPRSRVIAPRTGHVGMVVGSAARGQVWRPIAEFLRSHAG